MILTGFGEAGIILTGNIDQHNVKKGVCEYLKKYPWCSNSPGREQSEMGNKIHISVFNIALYIIWSIAQNLDVNRVWLVIKIIV